MINRLYYGADTPPSLDLDLSLSSPLIQSALRNLYERRYKDVPYIEPTLYGAALSPLADAVEEAFPEDSSPITHNSSFKDALLHSAEVFAAFKVHTAGRSMLSLLLDSDGNLKPFEQWSRDVLPIASHQFGSWLRTEYNTAILRAHQAADWQRFEADKDVLPNLRWVPSTSVTPGKDHMPFWGTVLPVDHPFWSHHRPGDRWNCKCSLEATDEDVTPVPDDESARLSPPQKGLESNPGKTAQLFDQSHPYFPDSCASCPFNSGMKNTLSSFFAKKKKDCSNCAKVNAAIPQPQIDLSKITDNREFYETAKSMPTDYPHVFFDEASGGVLAIHSGHNLKGIQMGKGGKLDINKLSDKMEGHVLEVHVARWLMRRGHQVILLNENEQGPDGKIMSAIDMEVDGVRMDIKSILGSGNYGNFILEKNRQIEAYNNRQDITIPASTLCIYFPYGNFDPNKLQSGINNAKKETQNNNRILYIKQVYIISESNDKVIKVDI